MTADREIDVTFDAPAFAAELRRLADALETGEAFTMTLDGEEVSIPADVVLSVSHESEDGEAELEFQLNWSNDGDDEDENEDEDDLKDDAEMEDADDVRT